MLAASFVAMFTGFALELELDRGADVHQPAGAPACSRGAFSGCRASWPTRRRWLPVLFLGFMADVTSLEAVLLWAPIVIMVDDLRLADCR